jgi:hypothetical protein
MSEAISAMSTPDRCMCLSLTGSVGKADRSAATFASMRAEAFTVIASEAKQSRGKCSTIEELASGLLRRSRSSQ